MLKSQTLLEPIGNTSVVEKVIDRITNSIMSGELEIGSKIPTEVELSERLNVGRSSVREAIKVLVYMGVLEIRRSEGTFVTAGYSDKMLNPLLYSLMLEKGESRSIIELRKIFEVGTTVLAIERATQEDIDDIKTVFQQLVGVLENENTNCEKALQADIEFHKAVERAAHNPLVIRISSIITKLTIPTRLNTTKKILDSGNSQFLIDSHYRVLELINARDPAKAMEAVDKSYLYWQNAFSDED